MEARPHVIKIRTDAAANHPLFIAHINELFGA